MLAEKQRNTNIGVGVGIVLEIAGRVLTSMGHPAQGAVGAPPNTALFALGAIIGLVGLVVFVWGCFNYAQGKGYSPLLGLLGLLSCLGLLILIVLPDKYKNGGPPTGYGGPSQPGVWPPPPSNPQ
jgi:hypothetical protein